MVKGQSQIIEYFFTVLFSFVLLASIVLIVYTFYTNTIKTQVLGSLRQVAVQVSDSVSRVYQTAKDIKNSPSNSTSLLLYKIDVSLPNQVSKRNYEVLLVSSNPLFSTVTNITVDNKSIATLVIGSGAKVIARTVQDPIQTVELDIPNVDVQVQGRILNGVNGTLKYFRYNLNGTQVDTVVIGPSDLIINPSTVS
ncbi:MAG: hypothetical protein J4452_00520 [Candidatus Aenigmarchaeota archaeon]|nr:hypothetical protein [Candidatus Aenigmarchaeota archaeon]